MPALLLRVKHDIRIQSQVQSMQQSKLVLSPPSPTLWLIALLLQLRFEALSVLSICLLSMHVKYRNVW